MSCIIWRFSHAEKCGWHFDLLCGCFTSHNLYRVIFQSKMKKSMFVKLASVIAILAVFCHASDVSNRFFRFGASIGLSYDFLVGKDGTWCDTYVRYETVSLGIPVLAHFQTQRRFYFDAGLTFAFIINAKEAYSWRKKKHLRIFNKVGWRGPFLLRRTAHCWNGNHAWKPFRIGLTNIIRSNNCFGRKWNKQAVWWY